MANAITIRTNIDTKNASTQLTTLENRIVKMSDKVEGLKQKKEELSNTKIETQDLKDINKQINDAEKAMAKLDDRMSKFVALGGKTDSNSYRKMQYDAAELENTLEYARGEKEALLEAGGGYESQIGTEQYNKLTKEIQYAEIELNVLNKKHDELAKKNSLVNRLGESFEKVGKRIRKLAVRLFIFSQLTKVFRAMIGAMKEGFENLAQYSDRYNASMSQLKSNQAELKNNMAAAFEPIMNWIVPALATLCGWLSSTAELISKFFAALGGSTTYTKASKQAINYAKSVKKAGDAQKKANNELATFDDLNVLNKKDSSGAGGSGEVTGGAAFEEGQISDEFVERVQKIKEIMEGILPYVMAIGAGLLAWKVFDFLTGLMKISPVLGTIAGVILVIAGLALMVYNYMKMWQKGVNWSNLIGYIAGLSVVVGALYALCGPIVAGIALIVGSIAGLVLAIKDINENGLTAKNTCLLVVSAIGLIIGVFLTFGAAAAGIVTVIVLVVTVLAKLVEMGGNGKEALGHLTDAFKLLGQMAKAVMQGDWSAALEYGKQALKSFGNFFISVAEGIANGFVKMVNIIVDAINSIKFGPIPDWVPVLGGKSFNLNIPHWEAKVNLPRLANGGITTGSTLAQIGEAGREAVLPLENNLGYLDDFADIIADKLGNIGSGKASLIVDGRELGEIIFPLVQNENKRIGTSLAVN
ncbi:MAG: hypothetical protein IKW81_00125 [Pseudobutyrivibrio sp.]|nr:hypothetical protein [Pseudobutyrivibrio sp.]